MSRNHEQQRRLTKPKSRKSQAEVHKGLPVALCVHSHHIAVLSCATAELSSIYDNGPNDGSGVSWGPKPS
jgi:hypothetical protein